MITPNCNDVLCGRGSGVNTFSGNIFFRELVRVRKELYRKVKRHQKIPIAMPSPSESSGDVNKDKEDGPRRKSAGDTETNDEGWDSASDRPRHVCPINEDDETLQAVWG